VHANDEAKLGTARAEIAEAVVIGDAAVKPVALVDSVIG